MQPYGGRTLISFLMSRPNFLGSISYPSFCIWLLPCIQSKISDKTLLSQNIFSPGVCLEFWIKDLWINLPLKKMIRNLQLERSFSSLSYYISISLFLSYQKSIFKFMIQTQSCVTAYKMPMQLKRPTTIRYSRLMITQPTKRTHF